MILSPNPNAGTLYPLVILGFSLHLAATARLPDGTSAELSLPWVLSAVYLAILICLALLLPRVHRFQSLRADVLPTSGLPAAFFSPRVLEEMRRRFDVAIAARSAEWAHECCICMAPTTPDEAAMLRGCRHVFHVECLSQWLKERASCPLCRGVAYAEDMTPFV